MRTTRNGGFTLVELMIVVAIVATISSIAVPKMLSARVASNENAAISTMRAVASAQAQLESSCAIDTDADGGGEYGYFGEMAGVAPLRIWTAGGTVLDGNSLTLDPPILPTPFANTVLNANGEAVVERAGYFFKIYLPAATINGDIAGVPETGPDGVGGATAGNFPDPNNSEIMWCCYGWPESAESTGNRVFFINQEGDVIQTLNNEGGSNTTAFYNGADNGPAYEAAFSDMAGDPNPNSVTGMSAALGITAMGEVANDGNVWTVCGSSQ